MTKQKKLNLQSEWSDIVLNLYYGDLNRNPTLIPQLSIAQIKQILPISRYYI